MLSLCLCRLRQDWGTAEWEHDDVFGRRAIGIKNIASSIIPDIVRGDAVRDVHMSIRFRGIKSTAVVRMGRGSRVWRDGREE